MDHDNDLINVVITGVWLLALIAFMTVVLYLAIEEGNKAALIVLGFLFILDIVQLAIRGMESIWDI